jgi:3-dehydrosphinganine reductase
MGTTRFKNKNVLITGGSSGIGLAIAKEFGKYGANLYLIARNPERLKNAKREIFDSIPEAGNVVVFPIDVSVQKEVENAVQTIIEQHDGIDILINNAGISICGRLEDHSSAEHEKVLRINYLGVLYTLQAVYPHLKTKPGSHIGFVSSVAGYLGVFGFSAYAASKFAVTGLAESIRNEAKDYGIGVTMIYPPDTDTPMYHNEMESKLPECIALSESAKLVQPEEVAQKFLKGILKNKFEVFCNTESRMIRMLRFVFPNVYFKAVDNIIEKDRRKRKKAARI